MGMMNPGKQNLNAILKRDVLLNKMYAQGDNQQGTYSVTVPKNSVCAIVVGATSFSDSGGASGLASTSFSAPNCVELINVTTNMTEDANHANALIRIVIVKANDETTVSLTARNGRGWPGRYYGVFRII